jgi:uncharacterized protein (DUF2141 family)
MKGIYMAAFVCLAICLAGAAAAAQLTVKVLDIRAQRGTLKAALVDSEAGWDSKSEPVARAGDIPKSDTLELTFPDLKPGVYAVMLMHDENDNGKLDTNYLGMPIEGYGFSNDPKVMRRATFDEAKFAVGATDLVIVIHLR